MTFEEAEAKRLEAEGKLLPCPFCGSKALLSDQNDSHYGKPSYVSYYVGCSTPECIMFIADADVCDSLENDIKMWNRRNVNF